MGESKHTPGPWKVFSTVHGKVIGIGRTTGEGIADCGFGVWGGGDAESNANARLIATAPELLDALKLLLSSAQDFQTGVAEAEAAIAKATGAA